MFGPIEGLLQFRIVCSILNKAFNRLKRWLKCVHCLTDCTIKSIIKFRRWEHLVGSEAVWSTSNSWPIALQANDQELNQAYSLPLKTTKRIYRPNSLILFSSGSPRLLFPFTHLVNRKMNTTFRVPYHTNIGPLCTKPCCQTSNINAWLWFTVSTFVYCTVTNPVTRSQYIDKTMHQTCSVFASRLKSRVYHAMM